MKKVWIFCLMLILLACSTVPAAQTVQSTPAPGNTPQPTSEPGTTPQITDTPQNSPPTQGLSLPEASTPFVIPSPPALPANYQDLFTPVALGEKASFISSGDEYTIRILEAIVKQDDVYTYTASGGLNWAVPEKMKFAIIRLGVEYKEGSGTEKKPLDPSAWDFSMISRGHILPTSFITYSVDPSIWELSLAPGESGQGYLIGLSYSGDETPFLSIRFDNGTKIFSLTSSSVAAGEISLLDESAVPFDNVEAGTMKEPLPLKTTRAWYDPARDIFFQIRVNNVLRGFDAWRKLNGNLGITEEPPEGFEYILPWVDIQVVGAPSEPITIPDFQIQSQKELSSPPDFSICPSPCLLSSPMLYSGGIASGWVPFLVKKTDADPLLVLDKQLYFSLAGDSTAGGSGEVSFDEDTIGYNNIQQVGFDLSFHMPTVVQSIAFSTDNRIMAVGCDNHKVYLFDPATGDSITVLEGHSASVRDVSFSLDGTQLASTSSNGEVIIWSSTDWSIANQWTTEGRGILSQFLQDGTLVTGNQNGQVNIWNPQTGETVLLTRPPRDQSTACQNAAVYNYAVSPDGTRIGASLACGFGVFWNPNSNEKFVDDAHQVDSPEKPTTGSVAISPDMNLAAYGSVYYPNSYTVLVDAIDLNQNQILASVGSATANITALTYSPTNELLVAAIGKDIHVWWPGIQVLGELDFATLKKHNSQITALEFSADGEYLASGDYLGNVYTWKVK